MPPPAFAFDEATIASLQSAMQNGTLTSKALTEAYLARIAAVDKAGPALNSVLETNPDAVTIAAERDAERAAGKLRGPLHGIPVLVKDNLDTGDRMQTTAGSWLCGERRPRAMPMWWHGCVRRARCCSGRRISANGRTFVLRIHRADGVDVEGRHVIRSC